MAESKPGGVRPKGIVAPEEWVKIMRRMFNVIDGQLTQLEALHNKHAPNGEGRKGDGLPFNLAEVRAMNTLANTLKSVRVIYHDIKDENLSEEVKQQLRESNDQREELERRLARLNQQGEDE